MSSFNINGPSNQPIIQGSQGLGKDGGGGGNTGYMNMRGKKKNQDNEEDNSVFLEEEEDTFTRTDKKPKKKAGRILSAIAKFIKKDKDGKEEKDSFEKQKDSNEDESAQSGYEEYRKYNAPLQKTNHIIDDKEYEVTEEEDDYYNNIDI